MDSRSAKSRRDSALLRLRSTTGNVRDFEKRGIGFYLSELKVSFRRPIPVSAVKVRILSWLSRLDGSTFVVDFQLMSPSRDSDYSTGSFECRVIDLRSGAPTAIPPWVEELFFEVDGESG